MIPEIANIKGIHPGAILRREIKSRGIKNKDFAELIGEYPQTISAVINEKRGINANLSIKLGKNLGIDNDYFMQLQASYDVKIAQNLLYQQESLYPPAGKPNLKIIRKHIFWDTDFDKIDWIKSKRAIIKRVFERGNEIEIKEIINFYGKSTVKAELENTSNKFLPSFESNISEFLNS